MVIICVLISALAIAVGLGVAFSRPTAVNDVASPSDPANTNASAQIEMTGAPFVSVSPSQSPTKTSDKCFADRNELKDAVDRYVKDGCDAVATLCNGVNETYGLPIGSWCVGDVTDMSSLFDGLYSFNEDISGWNVSQVTDMSFMFKGASSFKQEDLSKWDTSAVTDMRGMFRGASSFNGKSLLGIRLQ